MTITNNPLALMESALTAERLRSDFQVAVLEKVQDQIKQQGQAQIELIEQINPGDRRTSGLDVYA